MPLIENTELNDKVRFQTELLLHLALLNGDLPEGSSPSPDSLMASKVEQSSMADKLYILLDILKRDFPEFSTDSVPKPGFLSQWPWNRDREYPNLYLLKALAWDVLNQEAKPEDKLRQVYAQISDIRDTPLSCITNVPYYLSSFEQSIWGEQVKLAHSRTELAQGEPVSLHNLDRSDTAGPFSWFMKPILDAELRVKLGYTYGRFEAHTIVPLEQQTIHQGVPSQTTIKIHDYHGSRPHIFAQDATFLKDTTAALVSMTARRIKP